MKKTKNEKIFRNFKKKIVFQNVRKQKNQTFFKMCENFKNAFAEKCINLLTNHEDLGEEYEDLQRKYKELKHDVNQVLAVCHNTYQDYDEEDQLFRFMSCGRCNKYGVRWKSGGPSDGSLDFYKLSGRILECETCGRERCSEHIYINGETFELRCATCCGKLWDKMSSLKEYRNSSDSESEDDSEEIISPNIAAAAAVYMV